MNKYWNVKNIFIGICIIVAVAIVLITLNKTGIIQREVVEMNKYWNVKNIFTVSCVLLVISAFLLIFNKEKNKE